VTLVYVVLAWAAGLVVADRSAALHPAWWWLVAAGAVIAVLFRRERALRLAGLCLLACGIAIWRYAAAQPVITPTHVGQFNDRGYATVLGIVDDYPDVRENSIRLTIRVIEYRDSTRIIASEGYLLAYADRNMTFAYGDRVRVQGVLTTPPEFDTFSFRDYLARSGILTVVLRAEVTVLRHDQGNPVIGTLYKLRTHSRQLIDRLLPSPASGFLNGIVLGDESGISPDIADSFRATGTSHLVAISGSNISVVAGLLIAFFSPLAGRRRAVWLTIAGLAIYVVLAGASASVLRAAIMGAMALIAERFGRQADGVTSTFAAYWGMTAFNPSWVFDAGLLLSGFGTLGLILYVGPLTNASERFLSRVFTRESAQKAARILSDIVLVTAAAQITLLPLSMFLFREFSWVAFPVNVLVASAQGAITILGLLVVLLGSILEPLGQAVAYIVNVPISYTVAIIRSASTLPRITFPVDLNLTLAVVYYVALFGLTALAGQPPDTRRRIIDTLRRQASTPLLMLIAGSVAVTLWAAALSRPDGRLHVHFLAISDGHAVLIQTPGGAHVLIDGGDNPTRLQTALGDRLPFAKQDLDALIITQARRATMAAIPPLLDRYRVQSAVFHGQLPDDDNGQALAVAFAKHGIEPHTVTAQYQLQTSDGVRITVLFPASVPPPDTQPTDAPLVLLVSYGQASFVITSRMSEKAVNNLLDSVPDLRAVVLELPSSGDEKANPPAFINAVRPQVAVISAEAGNFAAQPDPVVLNERLQGIIPFRTDTQGDIEIVTDGATLWVHSAAQR
jgi:competence protein ComEC